MSTTTTTTGERSTRTGFGTRLSQAMAARGPLCVGIDPHVGLLHRWDLPDDARGVREFSLRVVEAVAGQVAAVKPQSAFFERYGSAGMAALEETIAACRAAGLLCVVDAKRGDIGSTMDGYADAFLGKDSGFAGDAVTLSPYLGFETLRPAIEAALATGRGVFVLALTSNPEGAEVQHALVDGVPVAAVIARHAAAANVAEIEAGAPLGSVGLVVGATIGSAARDLGVDLAAVRGPLLAPGVGAQGGGAAQIRDAFAGALGAVLPSSSRDILRAGPSVDDLRAAARAINAELRDAVGQVPAG
ncbi:orotidine-5'-phosphate decarboxylase [Occultella glacieicola]|uniref:Orotidine 5'-phosphate decarboxylase n=1 Tax=Occultella glacieicola TaxID=2518684 RepID=A0ABY2E3Q9_9MICO|nr:orotidine-5'-phosphate decarboxylase [Occultella glacieicola]TDE92498.1 orotidine-5'-phosphate decarboxylase [Occultella glacieicola]